MTEYVDVKHGLVVASMYGIEIKVDREKLIKDFSFRELIEELVKRLPEYEKLLHTQYRGEELFDKTIEIDGIKISPQGCLNFWYGYKQEIEHD